MTPELPKISPDQSAENPLSQYEERFGELQSEIINNFIKPTSALIVACGDSNDPSRDNHLTISKGGRWSIGFGREGVAPLDEDGFRGVLQGYAYARALNSLSNENVSINEYMERTKTIKKTAIQEADDNPIPLAIGLLKSMEEALKKYRENPW